MTTGAKTGEFMDIEDIGYVEELRQRLGLDENDTSRDEYILSLPSMRRVELLSGWYFGDEAWAGTFKEWCESQGIYWTSDPDASGVIP